MVLYPLKVHIIHQIDNNNDISIIIQILWTIHVDLIQFLMIYLLLLLPISQKLCIIALLKFVLIS